MTGRRPGTRSQTGEAGESSTKVDSKALAYIRLHLTPYFKAMVADCKTATEAWGSTGGRLQVQEYSHEDATSQRTQESSV